MKELRKHVDGRLAGLRNDRLSWWVHWQELANYILPRRYRWLVTPNQAGRGSPINTNIIDSTGTEAAKICSSGMMAGITSPTRPWFKLEIENFTGLDETHPVSVWIEQVQRLMSKVFSESNFYNAMAIVYGDLAVFGTSALIIYEDFDDVIRCYNPCLGEYYLANSPRGDVDTFYREFSLSVSQIVKEFGIDNCSESVKALHRAGGANLSKELVIAHGIEPMTSFRPPGLNPDFTFFEVYWEKGSSDDCILRKKGFFEMPGLFPRWDVVSNDAYGRSPGMDALGDIKQLQHEQRRKAQAIDKTVNPPMVADVQLKNQPASLLPGGITYVSGMNSAGFKPAFQFNPPIQELMMDIQQVQLRIKSTFFNDLFMMISNLTTVRSAAEIDARREEKMISLGPVLERIHGEALSKAITRVYNILSRGKLLPPPPAEIQGQAVKINFVSMLAEAQRVAATSGVERVLGLAGNLAAAAPDVMDNIDVDQAINEYGSMMSVTMKMFRDKKVVDKIRADRAKQNQQAQLLEQTVAGAKGAKTLSETDVGGGQNALQQMIGG